MARLPQRLPSFGVGQRGIPDVIRLEDDEYIYLGTDNDFRMYCDSSGNFNIDLGTTNKFMITSVGNVWVPTFFSVSSRIETISSAAILRLKGTSGTGYVAVGSGSTNHSLDSNNDLLVSGELEVDGNVFFDGSVISCNGTEIKNVKHILKKETTASLSPGATAGTYGTAIDVNPATGYYGIIPHRIKITANNLGAETLTVRVTATYSDGTTNSVTHDFTSNVSYWLTDDEMETLWKDGVAITKLSFDCASSIDSSTATATGTVIGQNT